MENEMLEGFKVAERQLMNQFMNVVDPECLRFLLYNTDTLNTPSLHD